MSLRIFLQDNPRILLLASGSHVLTFRHNTSGFDGVPERIKHSSSSIPKCAVEFATLKSLDLSSFRMIKPSGIHGTLGLINIDADIFLCVISGAIKVATVRPDENVQKILSVDFCSLLSFDMICSVWL